MVKPVTMVTCYHGSLYFLHFQEAKMDFDEDEAPDVVIANDNTYDTAENNA